MSEGPHGFGQLRRALPGVTPKVLREQLRQLHADGLVSRQPLTPPSAVVQYRITPYGRTLGPVFETLWRWGAAHLARPHAEQGTWAHPPRAARR